MSPELYEWSNLILRWLHVVAAIYWVGQTYLFAWLDGRFAQLESAADGSSDGVWMVHSGGFYRVEKATQPAHLPPRLYWTKWESLLTGISGIGLLVVYYFGGLMLPRDSELSLMAAVGIGIGTLVVGWFTYDTLWNSPLGKNEPVAVTLSFALLVVAMWGLSMTLSGRAAFMHVGAMLGLIMVSNVWERILPSQRQMIAALEKGEPIDQRLATRAKLRSKHNGFLSIPVVLIMLSNHFPTTTYGHRANWLMLAVFLLAGWGVRYFMKWLEDREPAAG